MQGARATRPAARYHRPCASTWPRARLPHFCILQQQHSCKVYHGRVADSRKLQQVTYTFGSATRARLSTTAPAAINQDAFLTFPTFLAAEQALVGVLDGHGPQGEPGTRMSRPRKLFHRFRVAP